MSILTRAERVLNAVKTRGPLTYGEITEVLTGMSYVPEYDKGVAGNLLFGDSNRTGLVGKFLRRRADGRYVLARKNVKIQGPFSTYRTNARR